jgi:F0F1-type ATP synthase membrane subunit c/vacuolar-type H+-ATPase subunit K
MPVESKSPGQVAFILWLSMLLSQLAVFGVGQFLPPAPDGSQSPEDLELMAMLLTALGAGTALVSALAVPILFRGQNFQTIMILRYALAESATIFGLVLAMLGAEMLWVYILTGLGLVAHISAFPTEREREAYAKLGPAPK